MQIPFAALPEAAQKVVAEDRALAQTSGSGATGSQMQWPEADWGVRLQALPRRWVYVLKLQICLQASLVPLWQLCITDRSTPLGEYSLCSSY